MKICQYCHNMFFITFRYLSSNSYDVMHLLADVYFISNVILYSHWKIHIGHIHIVTNCFTFDLQDTPKIFYSSTTFNRW